MSDEIRIREQLRLLYGRHGEKTWIEINNLLNEFKMRNPHLSQRELQLDEKDIILITYGDQFREAELRNLQSLSHFLNNNLSGYINRVHILPFYPYSSDDGFSVIDYRQVDPQIGTWEDITQITNHFQLMFDAVINHISRKSAWFQAFTRGESPYKDYFISVDPAADLSSIFRPRALPLISAEETKDGEKFVWTTFSEDQIDLDYANPLVLLEIIDLLLFYVERGARLIRLDAIGYAWKQIGTSSLNLPQAHSLVKIFHSVFNIAAPQVGLITETNVPHEENIKYFGEPSLTVEPRDLPPSGDEAQMVYQFSLAPLILHSFYSGDVSVMTNWVRTLSVPYQNAAFCNFIASHDGIGVMPAKGLLTDTEIEALVVRTKLHGGEVSHKTNSDGSKSVYELNITLYDALNNPVNENPEVDVKRFLASQAIMLSLAGVPGIYIHSLFGSRNCHPCVESTGRARSINREKFVVSELLSILDDDENIHANVFSGYQKLLSIRKSHPSYNPSGPQKVFDNNPHVFTLLRSATQQQEHILCLINVSPQHQEFHINMDELGLLNVITFSDLLGDQSFHIDSGQLDLIIEGFQTMWLIAGEPIGKN
jgi:sucrose phosphorylase